MVGTEYLLTLSTRYRLREYTVTVGHMKLVIWTTTGVDDLLTDDTDPDEIPYWAELWPSAIALGRRLVGNIDICDRTFLELGCGTALPSIVAALSGARVTATDYSEDALLFAEANAEVNNASGIRFRIVDWRCPPEMGQFDIVAGADILYERKLHPYVSRIIKDTVAPRGRALIADPCRPAAVDFMADMEKDGWGIRVYEERLPGTAHELVMVYMLTRR